MNVNCGEEFDCEKLRSKLHDIIEVMFSKELSEKDYDILKINNDIHKYITENVVERSMEIFDNFWESRNVNEKLILLNKLKQSASKCPAWRPTTGIYFGNAIAMVELKKRREIIERKLSKVLQQNAKLENGLKETFEQTQQLMDIMKTFESNA